MVLRREEREGASPEEEEEAAAAAVDALLGRGELLLSGSPLPFLCQFKDLDLPEALEDLPDLLEELLVALVLLVLVVVEAPIDSFLGAGSSSGSPSSSTSKSSKNLSKSWKLTCFFDGVSSPSLMDDMDLQEEPILSWPLKEDPMVDALP